MWGCSFGNPRDSTVPHASPHLSDHGILPQRLQHGQYIAHAVPHHPLAHFLRSPLVLLLLVPLIHRPLFVQGSHCGSAHGHTGVSRSLRPDFWQHKPHSGLPNREYDRRLLCCYGGLHPLLHRHVRAAGLHVPLCDSQFLSHPQQRPLPAYNLVMLSGYNYRDNPTFDISLGVVAGVLAINYVWPYEACVELRKGLSGLFLNLAWLYNKIVSLNSTLGTSQARPPVRSSTTFSPRPPTNPASRENSPSPHILDKLLSIHIAIFFVVPANA
ncbi:hypothetical protein BC938DRAFT_479028 [Jimgerdemannia flammicorona]|uniref:Uncharacterized protein n=1 Tax=Jimgerdemannia flammicorona TaxID=994334 RepID=A0A433QLS5_9FUNG|nr:hypothetical protein BC938DRAFT_479028 [Jimgerdemannia flammicorona]